MYTSYYCFGAMIYFFLLKIIIQLKMLLDCTNFFYILSCILCHFRAQEFKLGQFCVKLYKLGQFLLEVDIRTQHIQSL